MEAPDTNRANLPQISAGRSNGKALIACLIIAALLMSACSSAQIVTTLEDVVTAAEIAVPVIGAATGLPPAILTQIVTYLQAVSEATSQASTILAGTATSAEKTAQILAVFASVAGGLNLSAGVPAEVLAVVQGVIQAVVSFLSNFPVAAAAPPPSIKISTADQVTLANVNARSVIVLSKLRGMKK